MNLPRNQKNCWILQKADKWLTETTVILYEVKLLGNVVKIKEVLNIIAGTMVVHLCFLAMFSSMHSILHKNLKFSRLLAKHK
jgi:hypothetical protein